MRRRLVRQVEKDGLMAEAIVMLLLNNQARVDELVTLTRQRIQLRGPYIVDQLGRRANVTNVHPHRFHDTARRLVETVDLPTLSSRSCPSQACHGADLQPV